MRPTSHALLAQRARGILRRQHVLGDNAMVKVYSADA
jgi:hypothetical protein